jgi:hypothetical protein
MNNIKTIHFTSETEKPPEIKERRKKIVASNDLWKQSSLSHSTQSLQLQLLESFEENNNEELDEMRILTKQLKIKQSGYKSQDTLKELYNPELFVTIHDIIQLLIQSKLSCYYCGCWTLLFYEFVRDSKQWTLERISNSEGHNRDNVMLACLECNLKRRTMYHERFLATKQLHVNKLQ